MLKDPEITKLIILGLAGACAVLLLAVLILAFKRNVYYVNDKGQEIQKPTKKKKAKKVKPAPTETPAPIETPIEAPVEAAVEAPIVAEEVVHVEKEVEAPIEAAPVEEVVEEKAVEPVVQEEVVSDNAPKKTLEVPIAQPTPKIKGALVRLTIGGESEERAIDHLPCLIGRESASCDFVIAEPAVSRRHARMLVENEELYIEDVSEHNGTFVNGTKLPSLGRTQLHEQDQVKLGRASIVVEKILY